MGREGKGEPTTAALTRISPVITRRPHNAVIGAWTRALLEYTYHRQVYYLHSNLFLVLIVYVCVLVFLQVLQELMVLPVGCLLYGCIDEENPRGKYRKPAKTTRQQANKRWLGPGFWALVQFVCYVCGRKRPLTHEMVS